MPLFLPIPMADISNPSQQGCSLELQEALNHWLELAKKMQQIAPLPPSIHSFIYEASDTRRKRADWQRLLEKLAPVSLLLTSLQGSSARFFFPASLSSECHGRENSGGWRMSIVDLSFLPAGTFQRDLSRVFCRSPGVTVASLRGRSSPASITTFYMFVGSTQICEGQCSYHPENGFFVHCSCFSFKNEVFYGASISKLFYVKHIPKMSLKIFHKRTRTQNANQTKQKRCAAKCTGGAQNAASSLWSHLVLDREGPEKSSWKPCVPLFPYVPVHQEFRSDT